MLSFLQTLLFFAAFVFHPAIFNKFGCEIEARSNAADISYLEATGNAAGNRTTNSKNPAAATELDMLMPPIEFTDVIASTAVATLAPSHVIKENGEEHYQLPAWWHSFDALLTSLSMMVILVLMVVTTQCMWRRHIELRAAEWEAESTRIFCSTPYYADRSQILVY